MFSLTDTEIIFILRYAHIFKLIKFKKKYFFFKSQKNNDKQYEV